MDLIPMLTSRNSIRTALVALASFGRSGAIAGLLAALFLASSPSVAQSLVPPPERIVLDENSVDVTTGAFSLSTPDLSIGSGLYGLTLTRFRSPGSGGDSFFGFLEVHMYGQWNVYRRITASWGNQSWIVEGYGGNSRARDGSSIGINAPSGYKLTTRDGTVITYSMLTPGYFDCQYSGVPCNEYYFPTSVVYPNGLVVTPHYRVFLGSPSWHVRVQSVTSNAGYQIKFTYASNTISDDSDKGPWLRRTGAIAINSGVEYCAPTADSCTLNVSWPTVSYDQGNVTDALGRTTQYTSGATFYRIKTPGSAADNIQYTLASFQENDQLVRRVTAVTRGSNTWTYTYALDRDPDPTRITVTSVNPQGKQTVYEASIGDSARRLESVKDPLNRSTLFSSCSGTDVYSVTSPEGNRTVRGCDARGNININGCPTEGRLGARKHPDNCRVPRSNVWGTADVCLCQSEDMQQTHVHDRR